MYLGRDLRFKISVFTSKVILVYLRSILNSSLVYCINYIHSVILTLHTCQEITTHLPRSYSRRESVKNSSCLAELMFSYAKASNFVSLTETQENSFCLVVSA